MFPHLLKAVFGSSGAAHDAHAQTAADQSYDAAVRSSALEQSREDYTDRMPGTLQPGARRPDSRPHRQEQQNPRRTRYKRPNISEDEKRLIGDYDTPADAVYLPAPASYFDDQEALMVPPKPGSSRSLKPVNTINRDTPTSSHKRTQKTYGTKSAPGAKDRRLSFLETVGGEAVNGEAVYDFEPRPRKRVKVQHNTSCNPEIIDGDDDEVMEVPRPLPEKMPRPPRAPSPAVSRPHLSIENATSSQSRSLSTPYNAFQTVSSFADPHRKAARRHNRPQPSSTMASASPSSLNGSRRGSYASQAINLDDTDVPMTLSSKGSAERLQSGTGHDFLDADADELQIEDPAKISKYFANNSKGALRTHISTKPRPEVNLRDTFQRTVDPDPIEDEDELAGDMNHKPFRRKPSPLKPASSKVSVTAEEIKEFFSHGWRLLYARSYEMNLSGLLSLERLDSKTYQVKRCRESYESIENGYVDELDHIYMTKIVASCSDDESRIRIKGSADSNGDVYWYDFQFGDYEGFNEFRAHVGEQCRRGCPLKPVEHMKKLFDHPLQRNHNVNTSITVPDYEIQLLQSRTRDANQRTTQRPNQHRGLMLKRMDAPTHIIPPVAPSRNTRTTRNTQPSYGEDERRTPDNEPIKFSEKHGLGTPWKKPVQYGTGRRRALVDFEDLLRLDEGEFLNDALIDFYMIYLFDRANIKPNQVYFFNTHFFPTVTRPVPGQKGRINYAAVARWTAKEDIFNYDYIVVPVCESTHWYLAIICNVNNIIRKPIVESSEDSTPPPEPLSDIHVDNAHLASTNIKPVEDLEVHPPAVAPRFDHETVDLDSEDVNLFEEEQRREDQPNVDNTISDLDSRAIADSPAGGETALMGRLTLEEVSTPKGIIGDPPSSPPATKKKCRFPKKYDPDRPIVLILDSLGLSHARTTRVLKDYILEEGRAKRGMEAHIVDNSFYVREQHIPLQPNYTDCGVYLLGYVKKFFDSPREFVTRILTREMEPSTDWPDMSAPRMRNEMRDALQKLAKEQRVQAKATTKKRSLKQQQEATDDALGASKPLLRSPIQLKASPSKKTPAVPDTTKAEGTPAKSPRKTSPQVVIPVRSQESKESISPNNQHRRSHPESVEQEGEVVEREAKERNSTPKKQKLDKSTGLRIRSSPISTRNSPKTKTDPVISSVEEHAFEALRETGPSPRTVRQQDTRGSSAYPIDIDDSQDRGTAGPNLVQNSQKMPRPPLVGQGSATSPNLRVSKRSAETSSLHPASYGSDGKVMDALDQALLNDEAKSPKDTVEESEPFNGFSDGDDSPGTISELPAEIPETQEVQEIPETPEPEERSSRSLF